MPSYAIGDIQGCFEPLMRLLEEIRFDPTTDTLWFTGDLVNRGPRSADVLRFIRQLGPRHRTVLGNHDLHLLAVAAGMQSFSPGDTLEEIIQAPDGEALLDWLARQPFLQHDPVTGFVMTHAGIPPQWDVAEAVARAAEISAVLQGSQRRAYLQHLYGNQPDLWAPGLSGWDRLRCITNYFTRMRFCFPDGRLSFARIPENETLPWFKIKGKTADTKIVFGHWAALRGRTDTENVFALDTGCVWGETLTALCLETQQIFSVPCPKVCHSMLVPDSTSRA